MANCIIDDATASDSVPFSSWLPKPALPWESTFRIMEITPGSSTMISPGRLFIEDFFMEEIYPQYFAQTNYERTHSTGERIGI